MARVCIIDDKDVMRDSLTHILGVQGHEVTAYADPQHALQDILPSRFEAIVSDLKMPGMDGIELLRNLRARGVETPFVLMTAYASVPTAVEAMKMGAFDYIQKPFEADAIAVVVERAAAMARLRGENEALRVSLNDLQGETQLIGSSRVMRHVRAQIERVAKSQATVLIQGESGTGKELVARAIHAASPRAAGAMMCLNCAALSATLLESELFGHERGAFTGADSPRTGRFELADGGTILLDEITEIDPSLQAKLLRVLQERTFEKVGSSATREIDVRVIATTNRDLRREVAAGRFREDLYYRLAVVPLAIPPLRERREDVPQLAEHFLLRAAARLERDPCSLEPAALDLLTEYHWPGNVRELENIITRASVLNLGNPIAAEELRDWLLDTPGAKGSDRACGEAGVARIEAGLNLDDMERKLIEATLERFNGHRAKTAEALGIGIRTLSGKLKAYGYAPRTKAFARAG
jgi:two-component system, NtrC family, response regulator HydG